jgi:hypothetical protein
VFDLGAVRKAHQRFVRANAAMVSDVLKQAGEKAEEHVRDKAQFTHRSGRIWSNTKARVVRFRRGGRMIVSNPVPYAPYLEHGTPAHVILPRRKKVLRFWSRRSDQLVFARRVNHPGTRPYRFLSAARDHAFHWARSAIQARMRRIARSF